jgi:hypothetical protein
MAGLTEAQTSEVIRTMGQIVNVGLGHLERIEYLLRGVITAIHKGEQQLMAFKNDVDSLVAEMNTETDQIASRIDGLVKQLQNGGTSAADQAAVTSQLTAISARLKSLGSDPANPIPPQQVNGSSTTGTTGATTSPTPSPPVTTSA